MVLEAIYSESFIIQNANNQPKIQRVRFTVKYLGLCNKDDDHVVTRIGFLFPNRVDHKVCILLNTIKSSVLYFKL